MDNGNEAGMIRWNTSPLYPSPDSPELAAAFADTALEVRNFRERYLGKVAGLTVPEFQNALARFEKLQQEIVKPQCYAHLLFAADSNEDAVKSLAQKAMEFGNLMSRELLFFELEIMSLDDGFFGEMSGDPSSGCYRHYLENLRKYRPHMLPEREEQLLKQKGLVGVEAFTRLFEELSASLDYEMEVDGNKKQFTGEELLAFLHHHDPLLRERAFTTFLERHADESLVLTSIFNNIVLDFGQELELRNYSYLMQPTDIANELPAAVVEQLITVSEQNYHLAREYFRLKSSLLGISPLKNSDIYAPLSEDSSRYTFMEARELVVEAFHAFNPEYAPVIDAFFHEQRIDATPRMGKSGGAFCMGISPEAAPFVLINYTGTLRDVATLAHELGHGLHFELARRQSMLNYHPPLPLAETASVFAEMLLTRLLLNREEQKQVRIALLSARIEDIIATTFRQVVLTRFEQRLHLERREGLLSAARICEIWTEENGKLYGAEVEMIPAYQWGWSYISHFIHSRFYCYSYTFAELLVLSLYQSYLKTGSAFIPSYHQILTSGGSRSPLETVAPAEMDINDPEFWQRGYDVLAGLIQELRALVTDRPA